MLCQIALFVWSFLLDVFTISRLIDGEKDLEILLLRQQLRIVGRRHVRGQPCRDGSRSRWWRW
jgi:hypothetical protein